MLRRVDVGPDGVYRPQPGHQQVIAAEHIERQEAVAVVIAVEEAPLLVAVHRIVGRVDVQNDLFGRPRKRGNEALDQNLVNRPRPTPLGPVLEAAQRRRARQRPVPPGSGLQAGVMAQIGVIVQILVAQRNPVDPLAQESRHAMAPLAPLAPIAAPPPPSGRDGGPPDPTAAHRRCLSPSRRRNPPRHGVPDRLEKKAVQSYNPSPPRSRVRSSVTN